MGEQVGLNLKKENSQCEVNKDLYSPKKENKSIFTNIPCREQLDELRMKKAMYEANLEEQHQEYTNFQKQYKDVPANQARPLKGTMRSIIRLEDQIKAIDKEITQQEQQCQNSEKNMKETAPWWMNHFE